MLDDDVGATVFVRDAEGDEEGVGGFAHYHGGEKLAA